MSSDQQNDLPSDNPKSPSLRGTPRDELKANVQELGDEANPLQLRPDTPYMGEVENVMDYGVFIRLTPEWGSDITGLVHTSKLPRMTNTRDYAEGDRMVVEPVKLDVPNEEIGFAGLYSPDVDPGGIDRASIANGLDRLTAAVESLDERVAGLETDSDDGSGVTGPAPAVVRSVPGVVDRLKVLHSEGYELDASATETREGGDVVELNLTLTTETDD